MLDNITSTTIPSQDGTASRKFYVAAWRWHFYAGLYVAPFLIMLAVTGLMMVWSSALLGRDGEYLYSVTPAARTVAVSQQAAAAVAAVPGGAVVQYIAPRTAEGSALFRVNADDASTMVAVDPYTGKVLGQWDRRNGLYDLANKIHGTLMIGDTGDRLIEVAAGFAVMLVVTGLFLWWPRDGKGLAGAIIPQFSARGRQLWKSLHMSIGVWCAAILLIFLVSGLSWAGIWGDRFTQAWSTFPAAKWDNVPLSDKTHAEHMNHDGMKEVSWTLEQTRMPVSGSEAGIDGVPQGEPVNVDTITALARAIGFDNRFQLNYPGGVDGVWTLSRDTMSNDSANPLSDRTVHVDQYSGKILVDVGFADYGIPGKAMAVGVAFHEGDMGVWNLAFNTLFCLSIIFLSVSGIVMWWKRRPSGAARLVAPALPEKLGLWKGGAIVMLAVALLFPLSGAVLVTVLVLDMLLIRHIKPLKRAIS
jgi:uncharacterized iron-regulated membrane protein